MTSHRILLFLHLLVPVSVVVVRCGGGNVGCWNPFAVLRKNDTVRAADIIREVMVRVVDDAAMIFVDGGGY